jgi:transcriptional regulator with XRE-family HTH domain
MIERDRWYQELTGKFDKDPKYWVESMRFDFVEEVERMMEERGVNRAELARRLDASPAYVTQMFKALFNPTFLTLAKIALAFDARVELKLVPRDAPPGRRAAGVSVTRRRGRQHQLASPLLAQNVAADRPSRARRNEYVVSDKPASRPSKAVGRRQPS